MEKTSKSQRVHKVEEELEDDSKLFEYSLFSDDEGFLNDSYDPYCDSQVKNEEDEDQFDDFIGEIIDYDPYELSPKVFNKQNNNIQFIYDAVESFKENINPLVCKEDSNKLCDFSALLNTLFFIL